MSSCEDNGLCWPYYANSLTRNWAFLANDAHYVRRKTGVRKLSTAQESKFQVSSFKASKFQSFKCHISCMCGAFEYLPQEGIIRTKVLVPHNLYVCSILVLASRRTRSLKSHRREVSKLDRDSRALTNACDQSARCAFEKLHRQEAWKLGRHVIGTEKCVQSK